ncbi:c-type cytochrome [Parasphingorhabdus sp.]|uniref:c-type cytochrome n=1 Tax=Parasphingorhabdus sp. TaxID=2709688 RepID=UPI003A8DE8DD
MKLLLLSATPMLLLTACGSETASAPKQNDTAAMQTESAETGTASIGATEIAATRPAGFAQCGTCHNVEKDGGNGIGPNLWGVAGNPAAQKAGYAYSPAMKSSGLVWDNATLNTYLKEPLKTVPGTKMAYAGLRNDEQRTEVIAYLDTLKD